jgi:hypothetical protein
VGEKTVTLNRKAQHDYHILRTLEAGLSLLGTEIKSIREGRASIREAYVRPEEGEMWLVGAHVAQYPPAASMNHAADRRAGTGGRLGGDDAGAAAAVLEGGPGEAGDSAGAGQEAL